MVINFCVKINPITVKKVLEKNRIVSCSFKVQIDIMQTMMLLEL